LTFVFLVLLSTPPTPLPPFPPAPFPDAHSVPRIISLHIKQIKLVIIVQKWRATHQNSLSTICQ
jgi:hypothetical protein